MSHPFSSSPLELVHPRVEDYLYALTPESDPVLKEMERFGRSLDFPMVGPLVGRFLFQLACCVKANRIFEMGSGFGYSAYWFAKAISKEGEVIGTEASSENAARAKAFFKKGGIEQKITFQVGNATDIINHHPGPFDIIFIDIDKESYPDAFHKALPKLRPGGLLIADNVLWFGRVVTGDRSPSTEGIREFTRLFYTTKGLFTTIVPLRDGVSISIKEWTRGGSAQRPPFARSGRGK